MDEGEGGHLFHWQTAKALPSSWMGLVASIGEGTYMSWRSLTKGMCPPLGDQGSPESVLCFAISKRLIPETAFRISL